jgi:hypothetical protein
MCCSKRATVRSTIEAVSTNEARKGRDRRVLFKAVLQPASGELGACEFRQRWQLVQPIGARKGRGMAQRSADEEWPANGRGQIRSAIAWAPAR